jgi:long-chain fatty acid transport protein
MGLASFSVAGPSLANGIYRNGAGARSMALAGTEVGLENDPISALHSNPAALRSTSAPTLELGAVGGFATGDFENAANADGRLNEKVEAGPEFGFALPIKSGPLTVGLAFIPDAVLDANWKYVDAPGGLGGTTSYGLQQHRSEITVLRTALGFGLSLSDRLSIGGSLGIVYNENALKAPYIFQSHPVLKGFKTLLDLETSGVGFNGSVGVLYRPTDSLSFSLRYQTETSVDTDGRAYGNAGVQLTNLGGPFAGVQPDFRYDARVENVFPQSVSGGVSWQAHPRWRLAVQVDWVNWSDSFDQLPIHLTSGNNADLNGFLGTNAIDDTVPLHWRDRVVFHTGVEFLADKDLTLRVGYAFGDSPVPAETLTPLTAAIARHTVSTGLEWRHGHFLVAGAYQYDLPTAMTVGVSGLATGEYSNSRTAVGVHWFGLTTGYQF